MKSAIFFLALVAICHSAPLTPIEESPVGLSRPSPISPDVISDPKPEEKVVLLKDVPKDGNRQKRDEHQKPDSVKAREQLHHHSSEQPIQKPDSVKANEGLIKHKRDTKESEKPDSVKAQEQLHHHHSEEPQEKPDSVKASERLIKHKRDTKEEEKKETPVTLIGELPKGEVPQSAPAVAPPKKDKREAHHEEGHNEKAGVVVENKEKKDSQEGKDEPQRLPYNAPGLVASTKKEKRDTIQKPDSVKAREGLQHNPQRAEEQRDALLSLLARTPKPEERRQRDIPVPTEVKSTPAEPKSDSTTPPASHRPTAKPVSELFHKDAAIHKPVDADKVEE